MKWSTRVVFSSAMMRFIQISPILLLIIIIMHTQLACSLYKIIVEVHASA